MPRVLRPNRRGLQESPLQESLLYKLEEVNAARRAAASYHSISGRRGRWREDGERARCNPISGRLFVPFRRRMRAAAVWPPAPMANSVEADERGVGVGGSAFGGDVLEGVIIGGAKERASRGESAASSRPGACRDWSLYITTCLWSDRARIPFVAHSRSQHSRRSGFSRRRTVVFVFGADVDFEARFVRNGIDRVPPSIWRD